MDYTKLLKILVASSEAASSALCLEFAATFGN